MSIRPTSAEELAECVRAHARVCALGGRTKAHLARGGDGGGVEIGSSRLAGVTEYESSEYTFTAKAGTTVREVAEALGKKRQYLPFDPHLVEAGATLGGTVAAGISGPARFRYGGLRDFLLGVVFVDGNGRLVRSGGKVVKNAAGFDLPKFFVGSLGRFGILAEVSFKVFPHPVEEITLRVDCKDAGTAVSRLAEAARERWELDRLEIVPAEGALFLSLGGPPAALGRLAAEIEGRWLGDVKQLDPSEGDTFWKDACEFRWAGEKTLIKVATSPSRIESLDRRLQPLDGVTRRYSSGGATAWLATEGPVGPLDALLADLGLGGLVVRANGAEPVRIGVRRGDRIINAVKEALDPAGRFPEF